MQNSRIEVGGIAGSMGAGIHNVDVSHESNDGTIGVIRRRFIPSRRIGDTGELR